MHPHHPELVTGRGVAAVAEAAERAGFDGFGHRAPGRHRRHLVQVGVRAAAPADAVETIERYGSEVISRTR